MQILLQFTSEQPLYINKNRLHSDVKSKILLSQSLQRKHIFILYSVFLLRLRINTVLL